MALPRIAWAAPVLLLLVALVPVAGAATPLHGVVTTCSSRTSCQYVFNTSAGTGWAKTATTVISFQLPGEAKASTNVSYSTYIARLTGTYTYWTVGSFLGTDVNTGKVVYGTTNTNYTITCTGHSGRGGGCTYTYTTDNGTIVVRFTQAEQTSLALSCSPTSINVAAKTTCTAKVTDLWNSSHIVTGKVHFSSGGLGSFSNNGSCSLTAGQCNLTFRPFDNTVGTVTITGSFLGNTEFYKSKGTATVSVTGGG